MSTPITNIPQGFLSLLGLRDMGGVPREVTPLISPGIDITDFLLLNRDVVQDSASFAAVGANAIGNLVVPPGELWYCHWFDARTTLGVGQAAKFNVVALMSGVSVQVGDPDNGAAGQIVNSFARDFWLPPGSSLGVRVTQLTAGPITVIGSALITRLRI